MDSEIAIDTGAAATGRRWPVARYRFEYEVTTPIRLPEFAGSMLRGAFGSALRRTACMTGESDCGRCPLYRSCPYPALFETPAPQEHALQKFSQVPNPYVVEPPPWGERVYQRGEILVFHMVLIGRALGQLPLISYAWQQAFAREVGRGTAVLSDIQLVDPDGTASVFDRASGRLRAHDGRLQLPTIDIDAAVLEFHTPLRLQHNGHALAPAQLGARELLMALARRASLLMEFHTDRRLELDFTELAAQASMVQSAHRLAWRDWTRFSSRQRQKMQLGGAVGQWDLAQLPPEFAALLQLGQWIHVGKNATFGLGGYTIVRH
jgi:CRISPR/Cas system endoribonuclease Cas6 (RAMP superfamily)